MSQEQYTGLHTLIDLANIQPIRFIQVTHMPFYEPRLLLLLLTSRHAACCIIDVLEPLLIIHRTTPDYLEMMKPISILLGIYSCHPLKRLSLRLETTKLIKDLLV